MVSAVDLERGGGGVVLKVLERSLVKMYFLMKMPFSPNLWMPDCEFDSDQYREFEAFTTAQG